MARVNRISTIFNISLYLPIILVSLTSVVSANRDLNEDNWREMLDGEWMVEFYAPWCPACTALAPAWKDLSLRMSRSTGARAAAIDVTQSPGLSGRFMVTALPTIFHVKDGEFRRYKGPRDADSMFKFIEQKKWEQAEPVPAWKSPNSVQMTLVAQFFKLSQVLRNVHNTLMETYGLPTWGSYLIFALCTIATGAVLGLMVVCVIDLLYPPRRIAEKVLVSRKEGDRRNNKKSDDEEELINDDIVDDAAERNDSDAERNSPSDSSGDDEKPADGGDLKTAEVRKRKPRKAD